MLDQLPEYVSLAVVAQPDPFVVQLTVEIDIFTAEQLAALATHPDNAHGTVVFDLARPDVPRQRRPHGLPGRRRRRPPVALPERFTAAARVLRIVGLKEWREVVDTAPRPSLRRLGLVD